MSFIIEQQAQFAVDIQLLKERQIVFAGELQSLKDRQAETREMIGQLADVTMSLARHGEETDRRIRGLGVRTEERFCELAEAHTDRRLDALIDIVDKLVRRNTS